MGSPTVSQIELWRGKLDQFSGMLNLIPQGYYALRRDDQEGQIDFLRITYPQKGQFVGCMKVQSQHAEALRLELVIRLTPAKYGAYSTRTYIRDVRYCQVLFTLVPGVHEAARLYALEKRVCCICGTKLTDERSRYLGIGPECEKSHLDYVTDVELSEGDYYPGITLDKETGR